MGETVLSEETLGKLRSEFYSDSKNTLVQNVCSKFNPFEACISRKAIEKNNHVFQYKIDSEIKPMTNQKNSGRCWLFAALNIIRIPFAKQMNIEEFEFSQTYWFFYDKIERSHAYLNYIVKAFKRNENVGGRLIDYFLEKCLDDGGQWDMLVNIIKKYGLMPKKCYPETHTSESTVHLNNILRSKLREYSKILFDLVKKDASDEEINLKIFEQTKVIYKIVGICLSIPNETFTWEYYDKEKTYHSIGPITPKDFYEKYVRSIVNIDDKVCLVSDPRNEFGKLYTIDLLGNMIGGRECLYNNQPIEVLAKAVVDSIKNNEPVWFGCDMGKKFATKLGFLDLKALDFELIFGTEIQITMPKSQRIEYRDSCMNHAMVFTGVSLEENGKIKKLRVENSWGEDRGEKGYLLMSGEWFNHFVFEVVVDKKYLSDEVIKVNEQTPIVLPAWDPMGTLAKN